MSSDYNLWTKKSRQDNSGKKYLDKQKLRVLQDVGDNVVLRQLLSSQDLKKILEWSAGYDVIFIDEAQRIPDIGWSLKLLIDSRPELKIIATGSASFDLAGKLGEPLTGRQVPLFLYPISISELRQNELN